MMKNKGFCLIEVMCSIAIFSIIAISIFNININTLKFKKINKSMEVYTCYMEGLKHKFLDEASYEKIKELNNSSKVYVSSSNVNINYLMNNNIENILTDVNIREYPYVVIRVDDLKKNTVLKISMELYFRENNREHNLKTEFLKGSY